MISNLDEHNLVEVIDSHKANDIIAQILSWPESERLLVEEVSIDMWAGFAKVIRVVFPNARIVYDRFHVMKKINEELDKIRRQSGIKGGRSKWLLMKNGVDLDEVEKKELEEILKRNKRLREAYEWKEEFRGIYGENQKIEEGKEKMKIWIDKARNIYIETVKTVRRHFEGICEYFANRTSSGIMEGINNKIKLIKRLGYGFTNVDNFRARLLAAFWAYSL